MQWPFKWFIGATVLLLQFPGFGQKIEVSDPGIELKGNVIHVSYYIYNSTPSDEYSVELRVTDSQGKVIPARALAGDVGEQVKGGGEKHIAWDLDSDGIEMNADIGFQLYVKAVPPPEPEVVIPPIAEKKTQVEITGEKTSADQPDELQSEITDQSNLAENTQTQPVNREGQEDPQARVEETKTQPVKNDDREELKAKAEGTMPEQNEESPLIKNKAISSSKEFKRTGLMLQSAVLPGLGLTRYRGGPHWIKGVAAYGCLAGSVALNSIAARNYEDLGTLPDFESKDDMYHKLVKQDNASEILAYAAIGIWVTDLVWTLMGTSDIKRTASHEKGLRINSRIDQVSRAPLLAFTYKF